MKIGLLELVNISKDTLLSKLYNPYQNRSIDEKATHKLEKPVTINLQPLTDPANALGILLPETPI